jgi:hypothetical protein
VLRGFEKDGNEACKDWKNVLQEGRESIGSCCEENVNEVEYDADVEQKLMKKTWQDFISFI